MKIEDIDVESIQVPPNKAQVTFSSRSLRGLQLVAKRNGRREFHLRYTRPSGTRTTVKLGDWPDIEFPEALKAAQGYKRGLKKGVDPVENATAQKAKERRQIMAQGMAVDDRYRFSSVAARYLSHVEAILKPGTVSKSRTALNVHLMPFAGGWDVRAFDYPEYEKKLGEISKRSKSAASLAHRTARAMFSYAVESDIIPANPLMGRRQLVKRLTVEPRRTFMNGDQIHKFLNEIEDQPISRDCVVAIQFQMLSGLRIGEITAIAWADVDFKARLIQHSGNVMKSGRTAQTVLSDAARRLLLEWKKETIERGGKRVFDEGLNTDSVISELTSIKGWLVLRTHDIRRTVRTSLQELGCPEEIRAAITNHAEATGIAQHYDQSRQQAAQLRWLTLWADKLSEVKANASALKVGIEVEENDPLLAEFAEIL
jgi:integrase